MAKLNKKAGNTEGEFEEKEVTKKDKVTVYGTGKSAHMKQNKKFVVHSVVAEKLIEKGLAQANPIEKE